MCTKLSERVGKYILVLVYPVSLCTVLSDTIIYSWGAEDGGGFSLSTGSLCQHVIAKCSIKFVNFGDGQISMPVGDVCMHIISRV